MWTVVYMSQDKSKVDKILRIFDEHNIMNIVKSQNEDSAETATVYEILVPQTELASAQEIIIDAELESGK